MPSIEPPPRNPNMDGWGLAKSVISKNIHSCIPCYPWSYTAGLNTVEVSLQNPPCMRNQPCNAYILLVLLARPAYCLSMCVCLFLLICLPPLIHLPQLKTYLLVFPTSLSLCNFLLVTIHLAPTCFGFVSIAVSARQHSLELKMHPKCIWLNIKCGLTPTAAAHEWRMSKCIQ